MKDKKRDGQREVPTVPIQGRRYGVLTPEIVERRQQGEALRNANPASACRIMEPEELEQTRRAMSTPGGVRHQLLYGDPAKSRRTRLMVRRYAMWARRVRGQGSRRSRGRAGRTRGSRRAGRSSSRGSDPPGGDPDEPSGLSRAAR